MRRKLIAGNWKMNGGLAANRQLLSELKAALSSPSCDVAVCAPAPYLAQCQGLLSESPIAWGGQDVSMHESGAYTGEVSCAMLKDFDTRFVIVGHSERRTYHGETNDQVARKTTRVLAAGLVPIVCVGETLAERENGRTNDVINAQVDAVLDAVDATDLVRLVLAYEPVWAIGTGKTATPEMAQEVHTMLRAKLQARDAAAAAKVLILYGGSMKPENAQALLSMPDIDGGLIGGAALKSADFLAIINAV